MKTFKKMSKPLDKSGFVVYTVINRRERVVAEQMCFQRVAGGGIATAQNREWTFEGEPKFQWRNVGFDGGAPVIPQRI